PAKIIKKLNSSNTTKREFHGQIYEYIRANFPELEYSNNHNSLLIEKWKYSYAGDTISYINPQYLRDWIMLFQIYQLKIFNLKPKNAFYLPDSITRVVEFYDTISSEEIYDGLYKNKRDRNNLAQREIEKGLKSKGIQNINDLEKLEVLKVRKE